MQKILPITRVHIEEGPSDIENQEEQVEEEEEEEVPSENGSEAEGTHREQKGP